MSADDQMRINGLIATNTAALETNAAAVGANAALSALQHETQMQLNRARAEAAAAYGASLDIDRLKTNDRIRAKLVSDLSEENQKLREQIKELTEAVRLRDELLLDWLHSEKTFGRLVDSLRVRFGVSDEDFWSEANDIALAIAQEESHFKNTKVTKRARANKGLD